MIQIRTLEIYTSLLEQTIVEENVLLDEPPKRSDLAQEMFRSCYQWWLITIIQYEYSIIHTEPYWINDSVVCLHETEPWKYLDNIIPDFSEQLIPLLTLPDCEVVIATLEALNALAKSPMGVSLLKNESISLLVDLLSFSSRNYDISGSRFYGPRKETNMRSWSLSVRDSMIAIYFIQHKLCFHFKTTRNHSPTACCRAPYS